jgi:hypothetical protein
MSLKEKIQSSIQELLYQRSVRQHNNLKVDGFIDIELVNNKGNVKYKRRLKQPNAITPAGKQMLLAHSAQSLLNMGSDYYGRLATISALYMRRPSSGYYSVRGSNNNRDVTNLLLNLDNPEAVTDADNYIPILSADGEKVNAAKVVGYANSDTNPIADGKAGEADYCLPEYVADGKTVAKRWKYPEGVATGTINAVAMAPFAVYGHGSKGLGIRSAKCLDKVNFTYQNFANFSTGFCPPGIAGITSDTEVLLNYSQDGVNQHKYDIATGETTDITSGWPGIPFPRNKASYKIMDYCYDGSRYLYLLDLNNSISSTYSPSVTVYDTQGGVLTYITNFTIYPPSSSYVSYACFLQHGSDLYVSFLEADGYNSGGLAKLTKSGAYYNSYTSAGTDYSIVGLTVPAGLTHRDFALKSLANGRYALVMYGIPQKTSTLSTDISAGNYAKKAYVFTDLNNVFGSIVGVIEWMTVYGCIVSTPSLTGFLSVDFYNNMYNQSQSYDVDGANQYVINNSKPSGMASPNPNGVWWSDLSWSSNVVSHVELATPIEKAENDILYVTYGYKMT